MADTVSEAPPHLITLRARHTRLEERIAEEYLRPRPDSELITRLKVEKLRIKEQIEREKAF